MFCQQFHFFFLLFFFSLLCNREQIERYSETFSNMLQVGMVAYNKRNLDIPLSCRIACQQIEQASDILDTNIAMRGFVSEK